MQKKSVSEPGKKILFFSPYDPCPQRSGAHIRTLEIITGLIALNNEVIVLSSREFSENSWDSSSIEYMKKLGVSEVLIYQKTLFEKIFSAFIRRIYLVVNRFPPVDSLKYTPFGLRSWFKKNQSRFNPDVIWMNYSYNDALIDQNIRHACTCIIDYHDLFSLNLKLDKAVKKNLSGKPFRVVNPAIIREDFFEMSNLSADKKELEVITSYDKIVAISHREADLLRKFNVKANIIHIPVTYVPVNCPNTYHDAVIFATGPNMFNLQGLFYFTERVLPIILLQCPGFNIQVTGACSDTVVGPQNAVSLLGYVGDLESYYCSARFAIGPVLGGTGQQIKITEAMAHGLPVVLTAYSAKSSPVVHGLNGFIAQDAQEFARFCVRLWQDPDLCRVMGNAARETIRNNYSGDFLKRKLAEVLS